MGNALVPAIPARPAVPAGLTRICVSGYGVSHNAGRAQKIATLIAQKHAQEYETWFYFSTFGYGEFLKTVIPDLPEDQKAKQGTMDIGKSIGQHMSSPFVWLEKTKSGGEKEYIALGGRDMFCKWVDETFPQDAELKELTKEEPPLSDFWFDNKTPAGTYEK